MRKNMEMGMVVLPDKDKDVKKKKVVKGSVAKTRGLTPEVLSPFSQKDRYGTELCAPVGKFRLVHTDNYWKTSKVFKDYDSLQDAYNAWNKETDFYRRSWKGLQTPFYSIHNDEGESVDTVGLHHRVEYYKEENKKKKLPPAK